MSTDDDVAKVDAFLADLPDEQREALGQLRTLIGSIEPTAVDAISYGVPAELEGYELGKGSIRFQPEASLPEALVRTLVEARVAELDGTAS